MKKTDKTKLPKQLHALLIILGVLVALFAILMLARGWLRMTVAPTIIKAFYGNPAQKTYEEEASMLQDPLGLLGYSGAKPTINNTGCHAVVANRLKTQVVCSYSYNLGQEIPTSTEARQSLRSNAEKLQTLLQANGWEGEYSNDAEYTSLVQLISSLTAGMDYQPDATYQKKVGNVECTFSNNTAFSSPEPAKMSTRFYCSRTFNILGEPSWN